jgi:hypothetical protein
MADTKTADEWKQVAANAQARLDAVTQQKVQGEQQIAQLQQQILQQNQKISEYLAANPGTGPGSPSYAGLVALEREKAALEQELQTTTVYVRSTLTTQQLQLRGEIRNANEQSGVATTGTPNTQMNTPPANADPGSNTAVPPPVDPPPPVTQSGVEATSDEFGNLDAAQERARNSGDVILSEDGAAATGIRTNPETGETFYTDPPPTNEPDIEFGNLDQAIRDQQAPDEFGDLEGAIADQEGTGLREPPVLSEEESEDYLRNQPTGDYGSSPDDGSPNQNTNSGTRQAQNSATVINKIPDWRFRIQLARGADYLYKAQQPGILTPLKGTDGVLFPYTPTVTVNYNASYEPSDIPHSNFKIYNYRNSSVENISISGEFTAQDTSEANYILAVIHFFRSVTKMFYGQDQNPPRGIPPPLCYISGHGDYAFNYHPVVITSFNMTYPNDVDYITATINDSGNSQLGEPVNLPPYVAPSVATPTPLQRLFGAKLAPGGLTPRPAPAKNNQTTTTRIPTKLTISLNALPVVTRNNYSNEFSLRDYATGKLMKGSSSKFGGIW